ncbi:phosphoribosylaminoimidazolesuccinocarboxamide synthase [Candidatus Azambacteria bacterium]|nr:phosphoribosylaminoimidazolesuccinocarboxamide synthase [Candidatus Azambacteria bacterium]
MIEKNIPILFETDFKNIGEKKVGKVRDIYIQSDKIILISTDRHSSFDRMIAHIPHKGQVLNQISAFWFEQTKDIVPNHVLAISDPNVLIAKKCTPLPIEVVVRGYITGVTDTSLWTLYKKGQRDFGSFVLGEGLKKNQKLDQPVLTPTTKSDQHDRPITPQEIISEGILTQELWDQIAQTALKLFVRGQQVANKAGLILADTKYEFGLDSEGVLTLIDEIHTPDSSRYWQLENYDERFDLGEDPEYFDKEFLRLWFKEHCNPYQDAVLPIAPPEMINELSRRYIKIFEQITGTTKFKSNSDHNIMNRIEASLVIYKKLSRT